MWEIKISGALPLASREAVYKQPHKRILENLGAKNIKEIYRDNEVTKAQKKCCEDEENASRHADVQADSQTSSNSLINATSPFPALGPRNITFSSLGSSLSLCPQ